MKLKIKTLSFSSFFEKHLSIKTTATQQFILRITTLLPHWVSWGGKMKIPPGYYTSKQRLGAPEEGAPQFCQTSSAMYFVSATDLAADTLLPGIHSHRMTDFPQVDPVKLREAEVKPTDSAVTHVPSLGSLHWTVAIQLSFIS